MIGNILVDLFIFFTKIFIHPLSPNIMIAAKLSRYTVCNIIQKILFEKGSRDHNKK